MTAPAQSSHASATPLWFGPDDRPLFGWLHLPPDGRARGGVVLAQPLGIEAICTYFTYRLAAQALADRGIAVLRFDYDGTGDSAGSETDPDRLDAWLDSLSRAVDALADTGVAAIGLAGTRMGGLFAAHEAARRGGVDALALWDPCLSGKAFLREQRFLRLLSGTGGDPTGEGVEAPGLRFEPETVKALADLAIKTVHGPLAERTLVLVPPELSRPPALVRRLAGTAVEWGEATGQDRLLDSNVQEPPLGTIDRLADWFASVLDGDPVPIERPRRPTAVVGHTETGRPLEEHTVSLGPQGLFGIVTEPPTAATGPTVVLVNEGNTHHIGQARIWVDLARALAPAGLRVLRFDLSGNGDSGVRPGQEAHVARAPEAIDDIDQAVAAIAPDDPTDVVLVGFCAGAYQAVEQAMVRPPRAVCLINPVFTFIPPEPPGPSRRQARQATRPWLVRTLGPVLQWYGRARGSTGSTRWARSLADGSWTEAIARRLPWVPSWTWDLVHRTLLTDTGISSLEAVTARGVETFLIVGPGDLTSLSLGAERRMAQLTSRPDVHLEEMDELDHAAWLMSQRRSLVDVVATDLIAAFGTVPARHDDRSVATTR